MEKTRHNIYLYSGDYAKLGEIHPTLPPSEVIRRLIRNHIDKVESAKVGVVDETVEL